ncbi:MAG: Puniceispirillum phage, partial [Cyanobacteriota bacterium]
MNTFVMGTAKAGLRQRVGYYGAANGFYIERDGTSAYFVERSSVTGVVTNTQVAQADWNQDPLDGTGPSGLTLDSSKAQILYMDVGHQK